MDITTGLISLGMLAAVYFTYKAAQVINKKLEKIEAEHLTENSKLMKNGFETAKSAVEATAKAVVYKLEQTDAKELRDKVKAGLEDRSKLLELADEAYSEIMNILSDNAKAFLKHEINDVEMYIRNLIEKSVLEVKNETNALTNGE